MTTTNSANRIPALADLTLKEKIGQMLCVGWQGDDCLLRLNDQAHRALSEWQVGGMVLMGRNVRDENSRQGIDVPALQAMTREMQTRSRIPLLVPTDQEGGRVARLRGAPFTAFPAAKVIGDVGDEVLAQAIAQAVGAELASVGINWDFAPCADVNSNPDNPVIGDRAFGSTVGAVVPMVRAQVRGLALGGVLACVKHFPGHGDTALDSHYDLPRLHHSMSVMVGRELVPFQAALGAGVPTLMTAHIVFPALDTHKTGLPATMNPTILTDLLRGTMGFNGLLITDCLEMRAVADQWGVAQGALLAAQAGADMLLVTHTEARQAETFELLLSAARSGALPTKRIDEAVGRVLTAKRKAFGLPQPPPDAFGSPAHAALLQTLLARSGSTGETDTQTTLGATAPAQRTL